MFCVEKKTDRPRNAFCQTEGLLRMIYNNSKIDCSASQVLKAVADSERLTRSRTSASSSSISPPRPQSAGKPGTTTHEVRPSPPRRLEAGGSNGATPDESPQSASRFRTVAAAAEEEAKVGKYKGNGV